MKKALFYSIMLMSTVSFGQTTDMPNTDWKQNTEMDGFVFWTKRIHCEMVGNSKPLYYSVMKIENTTNEQLFVNFNYGLQYQEGCSGCEDFSEHHVELTIAPNSTLEGDCTFENGKLTRLIVNPNLSGGWKFQDEKITNITIQH
jgi:hypothetical protein